MPSRCVADTHKDKRNRHKNFGGSGFSWTHSRNGIVSCLLCISLLATCAALSGHAEDRITEDLKLLRAHPADDKLREEVILLAREQRPASDSEPVENAAELEGNATQLFKNATVKHDFVEAAHLFEQASLLVPWDAHFYYDAGLAYEQGGLLVAAMRCFHFYLLAAPNAQDALGVAEHIGEIHVRLLSNMHPSGGVIGIYHENRLVAAGKTILIFQTYDCIGDSCGQERYAEVKCENRLKAPDCYSRYLEIGLSEYDTGAIWNSGLDEKVRRSIGLNEVYRGHPDYCARARDKGFNDWQEGTLTYELKMLCSRNVYAPELQAQSN